MPARRNETTASVSGEHAVEMLDIMREILALFHHTTAEGRMVIVDVGSALHARIAQLRASIAGEEADAPDPAPSEEELRSRNAAE